MKNLKKYLLTGFVIILPAWLTLYFLWLLFNFIARFLTPVIAEIFQFFGKEYFPLYTLVLRIISFIVTLTLVYLVGFIANRFAGKQLQTQVDVFFGRLPLAKQIYTALSKFTNILFGEKTSFQHVILFRFPKHEDFAIGFITNEKKFESPDNPEEYLVSVFIPTTPNPTTVYFLLVPEKNIVQTDISVDEALKIIMSAGIVMPTRGKLFHTI